MVSLWINPFGTYIFQFIFPATAICIFIVCCLFIVTFGTTLQVTLLKHAVSELRFDCPDSAFISLVYELLSILSLCLPSLRTERPNIHTGLKSSLEGRAALKSSFQFGQHPLLYFAHFVCTPPLPFPPSLFILWFHSAFLPSIHRLFILSFFSTRWHTANTIQLKRKKDRWLLTAASSLFLPLLKGRHSVCCEVSELVGVTKVCVCVCEWS